MSVLAELAAIAPTAIMPGSNARLIHGETVTFGVFELAAGAAIPERTNTHEQVGMVLSGTITFHADGEAREFGPGGVWLVPVGSKRSAQVGPEGAVVVEAYTPVRSELQALDTAEPQTPLWPS
jgi:quercetin dioxygenase-like cupin family protein